VLGLTAEEQYAIIEKKKAEPQLSHRQISGSLRQAGHWISPSSCYRRLKALGWVMAACLRTAPWKVARYEPFRPNQIWGEDWTILSIAGLRHYLLTIIDYFSRYIVAWAVVKTVTQREVQALLALAYMSEGIEHQHLKPIVRVDQGSPNTAIKTRRLIKDLEMLLSPARAYRPTDNARQERWYRTVKQEEIYCCLWPTTLNTTTNNGPIRPCGIIPLAMSTVSRTRARSSITTSRWFKLPKNEGERSTQKGLNNN